jgi:hypothetical protein
VRWADDGEVAVVEGGDALLAISLGHCDESGVGAAEAQIGVGGDQIPDPLPARTDEWFDVQPVVQDRLIQQGFRTGPSSRSRR